MRIYLHCYTKYQKLRTIGFALAFILLFVQINHAFAQAGASPAIRGNGTFKNSMYWINWDLNNDSRPGDHISNNSVRTVTTPQGITYHITITNLAGTIESYVSGQFPSDDLKTGYNWYKSASSSGHQSWPGSSYNYNGSPITNAYDNASDAHNSIIGIINTHAATTVSFRITVAATLNGVPASIAGMTVAGAESINGSNEYEEYTTAGNAWQAIDRIKNIVNPASTLFRTVVDVSNEGRTIKMRNPTSTEGAGTMIWFSKNADYVDITLKGGGKQAVAIGFLSTFDFGDAPAGYGDAIHLQDVGFTGGTPGVGMGINLAALPLAARNYPALLIGEKIDSDAAMWYSTDLLGDDTHDEDDEDGLVTPYSLPVAILPGATSFKISNIPVTNNLGVNATLIGWIDVNNNGVFDVNEAASTTVLSGATTATLNFSGLSSGLRAFVSYPLRLRLATTFPTANSTGQDARSIGSANEGEVEDHLVKLTGFPVSGKVFNDDNRNNLFDDTETLYNTATPFFAYAIDGSGTIVRKTQVVNGQYTLEDFPSGNITDQNIKVMLSATDIAPGTRIISPTGVAPGGYFRSGEDVNHTAGGALQGANSNDFVVDIVDVPLAGLGNVNFGVFLESLAGGISGKVFNDNNRNHLFDNTETLYNATTPLFAYVIDGSGNIVQKTQVLNGQYMLKNFALDNAGVQNMKVMLSATSIAIGTAMSSPGGMAPEGYSLSGEDLSQTSGVGATHGIDSNDFVVDINELPLAGLNDVNFGVFLQSLAGALTVFGPFEAKVTNGQLQVHWSTLSEANVDHFEVEISKDNINFITIGEIISQANEGNSTAQLNYTFSSSIGNVFSVLSISAFLALFLVKKRRKVTLITLLFFVSMTGIHCKMKDIELGKKLFIRVAQIDKHGSKIYSRTVQLWVNYP
ncbi:CshA/CshB family fibrillar adhesin-related protein [Niabella sp. CJ426]|uniref:CshA/CshB family fibrillar adhesin-related protein n=1 Tax=Niabella sp. CJ426 TaxID=3393740 RepID=UPI003D01AC78